jgi:hypothetical protein
MNRVRDLARNLHYGWEILRCAVVGIGSEPNLGQFAMVDDLRPACDQLSDKSRVAHEPRCLLQAGSMGARASRDTNDADRVIQRCHLLGHLR